ncbi:hypothetical protein J4456_02350 [Candidatus Pacearchaeota archaeon]|nr:hypothetical protein [Candidatus Pacearchaeota archaeon]
MTQPNLIIELREYIESNYDDPEKAIKVLDAYKEDFIPTRWQEMRSKVWEASNAERLDILLNHVLETEI